MVERSALWISCLLSRSHGGDNWEVKHAGSLLIAPLQTFLPRMGCAFGCLSQNSSGHWELSQPGSRILKYLQVCPMKFEISSGTAHVPVWFKSHVLVQPGIWALTFWCRCLLHHEATRSHESLGSYWFSKHLLKTIIIYLSLNQDWFHVGLFSILAI